MGRVAKDPLLGPGKPVALRLAPLVIAAYEEKAAQKKMPLATYLAAVLTNAVRPKIVEAATRPAEVEPRFKGAKR